MLIWKIYIAKKFKNFLATYLTTEQAQQNIDQKFELNNLCQFSGESKS